MAFSTSTPSGSLELVVTSLNVHHVKGKAKKMFGSLPSPSGLVRITDSETASKKAHTNPKADSHLCGHVFVARHL